MAPTQLRGNAIMPGTVTLDRLVSGYSIPTANLAQGALFALTTGFTMSGNIALGGNKVTGGTSPTASTDFVIKSYVDGLINGFTIHEVRLLQTTNLAALNSNPTVDGVATAVNDIILLIGQTTASQNGPWQITGTTSGNAFARPSFWPSGGTVAEGNYFIIGPAGSSFKNTKYYVTTTGPITPDTTSVSFTQDQSGTSYTAGGGLTLTGSQFAVNPGNGINVTGGAVVAVGDSTNLISVGASGIGITPGTPGQIPVGATSTGKAAWATLSGDATLAAGGAITVTKTGGTAFAPSATTDATNATNITSGTLPAARLSGSYTGVTGVGTLAAGTWQATTIAVAYGGTGSTSLTAHGVLLGEGTGAVSATAVGTNGQILLGQTGADPAFQSLTGDVTVTAAGVSTVNSTAGSGFTKYGAFVFAEVPSGATNGSNTTFTLANTPQNGSLLFVVNGEVMKPGTGNDYTLSGATITTTLTGGAMVSGDQPLAFYVK